MSSDGEHMPLDKSYADKQIVLMQQQKQLSQKQ